MLAYVIWRDHNTKISQSAWLLHARSNIRILIKYRNYAQIYFKQIKNEKNRNKDIKFDFDNVLSKEKKTK